MNWKQLLTGVVLGAVLGVASTFFLFQGRITRLETLLTETQIGSARNAAKKNDNKEGGMRLSIGSPHDGDSTDQGLVVRGTVEGSLGIAHLWAVVHPVGSTGFWPQVAEVIPTTDGTWFAQILLGRPQDRNRAFDVLLVAAKENAHQEFVEYLRTSKQQGSYPEVPLPSEVVVLSKVTVVRR